MEKLFFLEFTKKMRTEVHLGEWSGIPVLLRNTILGNGIAQKKTNKYFAGFSLI